MRKFFIKLIAIPMCAILLFSSSITANAAGIFTSPVYKTTGTLNETASAYGVTYTVNVNKSTSSIYADVSTDRTSYPAIFVSLNGDSYYGGIIRDPTTASATTSVTGYNPIYGYAKFTYEYY